MLWSLAVVGMISLVSWDAIAAQRPDRRPDEQTPRVILMAASDDSTQGLAESIVRVADQRISQMVSPHRLLVASRRDIDNTLVSEWTPKTPDDYLELARLLRAVGALVLSAHGRPDSLDVIALIVMSHRQPVDTVHFHAPSAAAAVDSLVAKLLADKRFRRGAT